MLRDLYRESKVWFKKLSEVDSKRSRFQDMAAEGLITFDELRSKLAEAEQTRERAQAELEVLDMLRENIEELERDKDAVMKAYAGMVPEELDDLAPEERHQIYKMLRLQVTVDPEMPPEVSGTFGGDLDFCELESSSPRRWTPIRTCCRPCRKRRLALSKTPCPSGLQYGCSSEAWQRCRASSISPNLQEL